MTYDETERLRWADGADAYARTFGPLCAGAAPYLLDAVEIDETTTVLDVGTGTGTVAALAAGRGARVTAVDAEPSMVAATAARLPGADVRQAILPDLPFPDGTFDVVVANFVINHVGDPREAVNALKRTVKPGGQVAVTIWPHPAPAAQALWMMVYRHAGIEVSGLIGVDPAKNFPRTVEGATALLTGSGLEQTGAGRVEWLHETTPDAWWEGAAAGLNATGVVLRRQTPEVQKHIRASFDEVTARFRTEKGLLKLPTAAIVAQGRRELQTSGFLTLK
jgi:SAM-dependent methyltransferase